MNQPVLDNETDKCVENLTGWIDCHIHLYPERLQRAVRDWFKTYSDWKQPYLEQNARSLVQMLKDWGVREIFSLHYAHKPNMSLELNRWVQEFITKTDGMTIHPFGAVHPDDNDLNLTITQTLDTMDFAGFKIQCSVMDITADDPRLNPIAEALIERDKGLVIHTGTAPEEDGTGGIQYFRSFMKNHPDLQVLVPHLGMMEFEEFAALLPEHDGLYFDISATLNDRYEFPWETFETYLEEYPNRFLFGTDLPLNETEPRQMLNRLLDRGWKAERYDRLLRKNALQFLDHTTQ